MYFAVKRLSDHFNDVVHRVGVKGADMLVADKNLMQNTMETAAWCVTGWRRLVWGRGSFFNLQGRCFMSYYEQLGMEDGGSHEDTFCYARRLMVHLRRRWPEGV